MLAAGLEPAKLSQRLLRPPPLTSSGTLANVGRVPCAMYESVPGLAPTESKNKMEGALLLNVIVRQSAAIL